MTLEEAIEILTSELDPQRSYSQTDINAAMNLGGEALKWRKESEQYDPSLRAFPLPGETEK